VVGARAMTHVGVVKGFNPEKGWGHIECPETHELYGKDVFLLKGQLAGASMVSKGDRVAFAVVDNGRGPEAMGVTVVSAAASPPRMGGFGGPPQAPPRPPMPGYGPPAPAAAPMGPPGPGMFAGVVKSFNPERGWGHIECNESHEIYGKDMFFMRSSVQGGHVAQGTPVHFSVGQGLKGPQAESVVPAGGGMGGCGGMYPPQYGGAHQHGGALVGGGMAPPPAAVAPANANQTFFGTIKSFNEEKGWGHISCAQTQVIYGKDMFLLRSQLNGAPVTIGDSVAFSVNMGIKGPEAMNVRILSSDYAAMHSGVIKMWHAEKGWGFIDCPETRQLYGKDIFLHRKELGEQPVKEGDPVQFVVQISAQGRPESVNVTLGAAPAGYGAFRTFGASGQIRPAPF